MWVNISKYLFKLYIVWSVCADLVLIAGIIALLFGDVKISFKPKGLTCSRGRARARPIVSH